MNEERGVSILMKKRWGRRDKLLLGDVVWVKKKFRGCIREVEGGGIVVNGD